MQGKMPLQRRQSSIDLEFALRKVFKKTSFRPLQREVIEAALDRHDVFLQAATSFGKSLCFQLPAIVDHGITIVVSPLLALMNNQVTHLTTSGLPVATLNSTTPDHLKTPLLSDLQSGHPRTRLLYITPEYSRLGSFRKILASIHSHGELSRIAIDEAHCVSEWGHDFRPAYTDLSYFKTTFPSIPIICLTATATPTVRADVLKTLALDPRTLKLFVMPVSRPNLHYEIRFKSDDANPYPDFLAWVRGIHHRRANHSTRAAELRKANTRTDAVSGIIYTLYRKDTECLAARLNADGIGAKPFHAGLPARQKDDVLAGWAADRQGYDVVVATTAFGMGIDKTNVRFVVHWTLPKSFEGYYQEAGRAGRDGRAAACIMYYGREDRDRAATMMARDLERKRNGRMRDGGGSGEGTDSQSRHRATSLEALVKYCESTTRCRHRLICEYFGESPSVAICDYACDWCKDARGLVRRKDEGLASEEWCSTQRESGAYGGWDEYD